MSSGEQSQLSKEFMKGVWKENQTFVAIIGMCPALAVTNSVLNGVAMGLSTFFVLVISCAMVSALRKLIPSPVRIALMIVVIAVFVQVADYVMQAIAPVASKQLGPFIPLIVVNCIILGRAEAFSYKNPVMLSTADAAGMGVGFSMALLIIGSIREVLGAGTWFGFPVLGPHFEPWVVMMLPPGGFFTLGILLFVFSWVRERKEKRAKALAASGTAGG